MGLKRPDFAGSWYPHTRQECLDEIKEAIKRAVSSKTKRRKVGGIVPHAGWFYSGKAACNVFHCLSADTKANVVILFGTHMHPESPHLVIASGEFWTPFGNIEVCRSLAGAVLESLRKPASPGEVARTMRVEERDASEHGHDNTIELQLPFIKHFFPAAELLPLSIAPVATAVEIGSAVARCAQSLGKKALVVGSTDLTHYGTNYGFTPKGTGAKALAWVKDENDRRLIDLVLRMRAEEIVGESLRNQNACCGGAAAAAVAAARQLGAKEGELLQYYTSYDIQPNSSFVGYAAIVFAAD